MEPIYLTIDQRLDLFTDDVLRNQWIEDNTVVVNEDISDCCLENRIKKILCGSTHSIDDQPSIIT